MQSNDNFNNAQMVLLMIGGTATGQAFGINKLKLDGFKRGFTKSPKAKRRSK